MNTQDRIQDALAALEQSFDDFLLETGFSDHPIVRLGFYKAALEIVTETPDEDPEFQNGIVDYLHKKISEYSVGLLRQWLGSQE